MTVSTHLIFPNTLACFEQLGVLDTLGAVHPRILPLPSSLDFLIQAEPVRPAPGGPPTRRRAARP